MFLNGLSGNIDLSAVLSEGCVTETTAPVTTTETPPVRIYKFTTFNIYR